jgi:hypothetical protein
MVAYLIRRSTKYGIHVKDQVRRRYSQYYQPLHLDKEMTRIMFENVFGMHCLQGLIGMRISMYMDGIESFPRSLVGIPIRFPTPTLGSLNLHLALRARGGELPVAHLGHFPKVQAKWFHKKRFGRSRREMRGWYKRVE